MDVEISSEKSASASLEEIRKLAALAVDYQRQAFSENSARAYRIAWDDFSSWCQEKSLSALPACPETVASYLADRATHSRRASIRTRGGKVLSREVGPLKASSLRLRMAAISNIHRKAGFELSTKTSPLAETWKGIVKAIGAAQEQKLPIVTEDIRKAVLSIEIERKGAESVKGIRDRALFLLGFVCAFRRSELVSLMVEDLCWVEGGLEVVVRRSKSDQMGKGFLKIVPYGSFPDTCPVRAIKRWLKASGICQGAVFRPVNRHGRVMDKALSAFAVSLVIKENPHVKRLAQEGADRRLRKEDCETPEEGAQVQREELGKYSSHSLRAGFCTSAAAEGVPEHLIMEQTGHRRSDTVKKYIRRANRWKKNAASCIRL